ncbi:hypothetical protein DFS34DRAFT_9539 [Phlyctochytrium arcticum]|nr:hypothetical protein DFS34DRAFT_9539 [Phlyctochytrium arcticum]
MEDHFDYARRLALNQRWRLWLTPDEGKIFLQACKDQKTWSSFMRGTFEPVLTPNSEIGTENDPPSDSTDTAESESQKTVKSTKELNGTAGHSMPSKLMIATFRIREMIFEQLIPELYPANRNATAAVVELNSMEDVLLETASLMKPAPLAMPSKKTEDDYDDEGSEPAGETPNIPPTDHLERGSVARMDIPIDDAYYTFDEDVDALSYASALQDKSTKEDQGESDQEMEKSDTSTMNKDVHSSLKVYDIP